MDHPSISGRERAFEAHRCKALDGAGDRGHDLGPAIGTGAPHRTGSERVETEADIAGGGVDAFALDIFGEVNGGHPRLRTDLKLDADAGVEIDAVENLCYGFRRRIQSITMRAGGAGEHQCQPCRAVLQIVQRLRVGRFRIRMIDPLHDLPGRGGGAAGDRRSASRAAIDRIDLQPIGSLADQFLERRAFQHPVDQLAPVVVGGRGKILGQGEFVGIGGHPACCSLIVSLYLAGNCHGAAAKPNGCFRSFSGQSRSGSRFIPSVESSRQRIGDAASRNDTVGRNLGQRHQHEGALEKPGMRQRQFRLVDPDIVIGDQVEVEGARTPARLTGAVAAELLFDLVQREQQRVRIEAGFDLDAGVGEGRLVFLAPGRGGVIRRPRQQGGLRHAANIGDGLVECRADVADIAAERDQHVSHVRAIAACASAPRRHPRRSRRSAHAACGR